ncbi:MAG: type II toxin-antitoxin system RelE/ParE family toxin [Caulobacteraceae bacterium]|nr:type II toxin-antitoxin system RelE/ParE family toxin [Caulobacteraceae bacterium]
MSRVTRTAQASADLDDIWLHVALDNPAAADLLIDLIVGRCQDLAEHPHLGPARPEIAPEARMLVIGDYLALYRVQNDRVEIVRVIHGARRLEGLFD